MALTSQDIEFFVNKGYLRIENAFSRDLAAACVNILWKATGYDPHDRSTWKQPVVRIGEMTMQPFIDAANTSVLHNAFDQLAGKDNWIPKKSLGSFPIRFPTAGAANDTGWHVDASFPGDDPADYLKWRINVFSRGRALLMLFLFSDVSADDAPTLIREGSHLDVAHLLKPYGEAGLSFMDLAQQLEKLPEHKIVAATGNAGTVFLCHPFIVHAAQKHLGRNPKFMAQPSLELKHEFQLKNENAFPIELAILR